jgi:hypothetical protein
MQAVDNKLSKEMASNFIVPNQLCSMTAKQQILQKADCLR